MFEQSLEEIISNVYQYYTTEDEKKGGCSSRRDQIKDKQNPPHEGVAEWGRPCVDPALSYLQFYPPSLPRRVLGRLGLLMHAIFYIWRYFLAYSRLQHFY